MNIESYLVAIKQLGPANTYVFGKDPNNLDWRLYRDQGFAAHKHHLAAMLYASPPPEATRPITQVYCPDCREFNALMMSKSELTVEVPREKGRFVFRGGYYAAKGAGLLIPEGSAAMIATADCPTIVAVDERTRQVAISHAGLGEIVNLGRARHGKLDREHESIVSEIVTQFAEAGLGHLRVDIYASIGQNHFCYSPSHEKWGKQNKDLIEYLRHHPDYRSHADIICDQDGHINLKELISLQFERAGVSRTHIRFDGLDTYTNKRLWSHSKEVAKGERGEPSNPLARNLVLVTNW